MLRTLPVSDALSSHLENLSNKCQQDDNVLSDVASSRLMVHQMQHVERLQTS